MILSDLKQRNHIKGDTIVSPYWSDYKQQPLSPFDEYEANRPNLVLCYGDSWTWGNRLGSASWGDNRDDPMRCKNIFGRILADALDADFANSAYPGISNYWITDRLQILIDHDIGRLSELYKKIYIVVVLTEPGREFFEDKFLKEFPKFYDITQDAEFTGDRLIDRLENFTFQDLRKVHDKLPNNCHMTVARNFTHTQSRQTDLDLINETWADVLLKGQGQSHINNVIMMHFGINSLDSWVNSHQRADLGFKSWMVDRVITPGKKLEMLLDSSRYNHIGNSQHPTEEGHAIWARYLLNHLSGLLS